jgi:prevent-host-death family protein
VAPLAVRSDVQQEDNMGKLTNIIPVSELRQEAAKLLNQLNKNKYPLIITQRGRAAAVMIGIEAYEKSEQEKELLRVSSSNNMVHVIGKSLKKKSMTPIMLTRQIL